MKKTNLKAHEHLFDGQYTVQEIAAMTNNSNQVVYNYANAKRLPFKKTYLTTGLRYEMSKMIRSGKKREEIAKLLHCDIVLVDKYLLSEAADKRSAERRAEREKMTEQVKELVARGYTVSQITDEKGYKRDDVYTVIRNNNLQLKPRTAYQFTDQEKEYISRMPFLTNVELLRILGKHVKCDVNSVRKEMRVEKERYYDKDVIEAIVDEGVGEAAEIYGIDEDILSNMTYAYDFGLCPIKDIEISVPVRLKIRMEAAEVDFMLKGGDFNDEG